MKVVSKQKQIKQLAAASIPCRENDGMRASQICNGEMEAAVHRASASSGPSLFGSLAKVLLHDQSEKVQHFALQIQPEKDQLPRKLPIF